jgi:hypothetical protein
MVQGTFWKKIEKKSSVFYEESYEIVKIFGGFGFIFLKSPYLANRF